MLTSDVNPEKLLGPAFEPLVSLAVAVILYEAGLSLDLRKLTGHPRRVVIRLISLGVLITWLIGAACAAPLLGMSRGAALELGAILVVSGPTVVGPLLRFVRPAGRLQRVLAWEGALIDPVGGILGAVVFHAVLADTHRHIGSQLAQFTSSLAIGLGAGAAGAGLLWLLLSKLQLGEVLGTSVQLAAVIGVAAACDVARDDTGLIAAIVMGLTVANLPGIDLPARRPFFETMVQLIIGLLFISIAATVTPTSLRHVVLPALALAAVLVFAARPLVAWLCTRRTDLIRGERAFVGWMAPRGIVAAATATTFSAALAAGGVPGAARILPATFVVIVATVALYGLTAVPVARWLHVAQPLRTRPLLVGGQAWVVELGRALRSAGLDVLMWAGLESERELISRAGLKLAPGELLASAAGQGAELEGVTAVLLLTEEDDFNALASTILRGTSEASIYRLAPPRGGHGVVAPFTGSGILFGPGMSREELARRHARGARITARPAGQGQPDGSDLLFVIRKDGRLEPVTPDSALRAEPGETAVLLTGDCR